MYYPSLGASKIEKERLCSYRWFIFYRQLFFDGVWNTWTSSSSSGKYLNLRRFFTERKLFRKISSFTNGCASNNNIVHYLDRSPWSTKFHSSRKSRGWRNFLFLGGAVHRTPKFSLKVISPSGIPGHRSWTLWFCFSALVRVWMQIPQLTTYQSGAIKHTQKLATLLML